MNVACEKRVGSVALEKRVGGVALEKRVSSVAPEKRVDGVALEKRVGSVALEKRVGSVAPLFIALRLWHGSRKVTNDTSVSQSGPYRPPGGVEEMQGGGRRVRLEWGAYITV
ncbi:hypothetical protein FHG87_022667 [Trinorchestia longiramus]|nr:hypothetical protein FHG87_022667 [Trinorchestia longiramus]